MKTRSKKGLKTQHHMPPCMILCGGMGTRLRDVTELLPKPMVPIGTQPIIWHIMKTYATFGVRRFILCIGYKREIFIDYFLNYHERLTDITVNLSKEKNITYHTSHHSEEDWTVTLAYTGEKTMTGSRVYNASRYLIDTDEDFFLTYGDAVSNIHIAKLYDYHKSKNKELTLSAIHPSGRFGVMKIVDGKVTNFIEKPHTEKDLINGGFMVLKKSFIKKYLTDDQDLIFERNPMCEAVSNNQMAAYVHEGFWQCMDIQREYDYLNELWNTGKAPWKVWS